MVCSNALVPWYAAMYIVTVTHMDRGMDMCVDVCVDLCIDMRKDL